MVQRLSPRKNETPATARKRFDGQLDVRAWTVPAVGHKEPEPRDPKAPWWWDGPAEATDTWMAMADAKGMI